MDQIGAAVSKTFTIVIAPLLSITTTSLPAATASSAYSQTVASTGELRL
jgi:hypothetical protein